MKSFRKWIKNKKEMSKLHKLMPVQLYGSTDRHALRVVFSYWKFHPPKERWQKLHQGRWEEYHKESFLAMSKEELELEMAWARKRMEDVCHEKKMGELLYSLCTLVFTGFAANTFDTFLRDIKDVPFCCIVIALVAIWIAVMFIFYGIATKYSWKRHKELFIYKEYIRLIEEVIKDDN